MKRAVSDESAILSARDVARASSPSEPPCALKREDSLPGMYPRIERPTLIQKSAVQPRLKKTARGGRKMARKLRDESYQRARLKETVPVATY